MGLDATSAGIQLFFVILLPGFMFFVSFRWSAGFKEKVGQLGSLCAAAFFGILLFWLMQASNQKDLGQFNQLLSNPLSAGISFALAGLVIGFILGLPVHWIRSIFHH
ncbi:MAG: hypothetical protein PHG25_03725 [Candidatus Pacebacteria bacterium]|nr:hypothetical protein [Candidatus Paceibacterota bacterium]